MNDDVKNLLNNMLKAIDCEREEERTRHIDEIKNLSGEGREKKGRCLVNLKKKKIMRTITGDILYMFRKRDKKNLPNLEFTVGDELVISQYDPLDNMNPTGIVYEIGNNYIVVASSVNIVGGGARPYRLDLFVSDLTYTRMTKALISAKSNKVLNLSAILSGTYNTSTVYEDVSCCILNEVQKKAVSYAVNTNGFYIIQGPPGTGKTYTAAVLVKSLVSKGKRLLLSADSNAAVDNLIRKCLDIGITPLRIGHPIRVNDDLKKYTLDYLVLKHIKFKDVVNLEIEIENLKEKLKEKNKPKDSELRGYSYLEIMELASSGRSSRGLSKRTIQTIKPYIKLKLKIDKLYEEIKNIRNEIVKDIISRASVVAATNSTCGSDLMMYSHFDYNIVDEASQASMPSTLIPIQKADRFVLIGDHYQLPPVVISEKAKEMGLDISLMDMLSKLYPYNLIMLSKQYRMNETIMNLVSSMFYDSKLDADDEIKSQKLLLKGKIDFSLQSDVNVIDVKGIEKINSDSKSYYNDYECKYVKLVLSQLLDLGVEKSNIGIITPYKAQVMKLKELVETVEVDTVDAFQGREKDVIIISFVRSNDLDKIGFLADKRRLNVAISRARKKLILIGNVSLLKTNFLFSNLFERISICSGK